MSSVEVRMSFRGGFAEDSTGERSGVGQNSYDMRPDYNGQSSETFAAKSTQGWCRGTDRNSTCRIFPFSLCSAKRGDTESSQISGATQRRQAVQQLRQFSSQ